MGRSLLIFNLTEKSRTFIQLKKDSPFQQKNLLCLFYYHNKSLKLLNLDILLELYKSDCF